MVEEEGQRKAGAPRGQAAWGKAGGPLRLRWAGLGGGKDRSQEGSQQCAVAGVGAAEALHQCTKEAGWRWFERGRCVQSLPSRHPLGKTGPN